MTSKEKLERYLFRGFHSTDNGTQTITLDGKKIKGEWVYGSLIELGKKKYICFADECHDIMNAGALSFEVIPKTIGQFTGLLDKNKNKIFEDDILQIWHENPYNHKLHKDCLGVVVFKNGLFGYQEINDKYKFVYQIESSDIDFNPNESDYKLFEVIGNIHDNPELLKRSQI